MNKDVIRNAKNKYTELKKEKDELVEVKRMLLKEGQNKERKKCLEVIKKEEDKLPSDEEILRYSFYNAEQESSICNIFVFIGAYRRSTKMHDTKVLDYTKADYFVYQNLEKMFSGVVIYPSQHKEFERKNIILRFKNSNDIKEKFYKLQSIYFNEYLDNEDINQEKVLEKLRKNL